MTAAKKPETKNMDLWDSVCKTDPSHTKKANVRGNQITAIAPHSQIMSATNKFGPYGIAWGFKEIRVDYTLMEKGLVVFHGVFFYPNGEFPIISSISFWKDGAHTKLDDDFGKKVETDALTKALSKIGFNADIFLGLYDDSRYVQHLIDEKAKTKAKQEPPAEIERPRELRMFTTPEIRTKWLEALHDKIRACTELADVNDWVNANTIGLGKLKEQDPAAETAFVSFVDNIRGVLFQAPE